VPAVKSGTRPSALRASAFGHDSHLLSRPSALSRPRPSAPFVQSRFLRHALRLRACAPEPLRRRRALRGSAPGLNPVLGPRRFAPRPSGTIPTSSLGLRRSRAFGLRFNRRFLRHALRLRLARRSRFGEGGRFAGSAPERNPVLRPSARRARRSGRISISIVGVRPGPTEALERPGHCR